MTCNLHSSVTDVRVPLIGLGSFFPAAVGNSRGSAFKASGTSHAILRITDSVGVSAMWMAAFGRMKVMMKSVGSYQHLWSAIGGSAVYGLLKRQERLVIRMWTDI